MQLSSANQITILRILLIAPFVIFMLKANEPGHGRIMRHCALAVFLIMCLSDALDGYIARVKKQLTQLGAFLDPMADKLLITCACVLLASDRTAIDGFTLPPTVVVLIIGKDLLLSLGFLLVYLMTSSVRIKPVFLGKVSTVLQLSMVTAVLIAPDIYPVASWWIYLMRVLWWSAAAAAVLVVLIYIRNGIGYIETFEESVNSDD
jgi:CDP-diacylglycerol--glycerol-3-phosphate 3-phosphatidyltransferase